jgi:hypothetical protein
MTELVLACQHLNSGTNLRECEGLELVQSSSGSITRFRVPPGYAYPRMKIIAIKRCVYKRNEKLPRK